MPSGHSTECVNISRFPVQLLRGLEGREPFVVVSFTRNTVVHLGVISTATAFESIISASRSVSSNLEVDTTQLF